MKQDIVLTNETGTCDLGQEIEDTNMDSTALPNESKQQPKELNNKVDLFNSINLILPVYLTSHSNEQWGQNS